MPSDYSAADLEMAREFLMEWPVASAYGQFRNALAALLARVRREEREACASLKLSGDELVELSPSLARVPNLRESMVSVVDAAIAAYRDAIRERGRKRDG